MNKKKKNNGIFLTLVPFYIFTIIFVLFPIVYMVFLSFAGRDDSWNIVWKFTLDNYKNIADPFYFKIFTSSLKLAFLSTLCIAVIGYPFGYFMAKASPKNKKRIMLLILIPFFTSSLIRLNSWIIVFRSNGLLDKLLNFLKLTDKPLKLLYSYPAVLIGMIYVLLPFMILSVYSSAEKLDFSLVEAARDLGASKTKAFFSIAFKLTLPGLLSGVVLTFVPSMGLFFIADILGGNKIVLIGSVIYEQMTKGHNVPFAAALSVILMILTLCIISIYNKVVNSKITDAIPG